MNISILVPVRNYDLVAFIHSLTLGMENVREFSDIIIGDDGSSEEFRKTYRSLAGKSVKVIESEKNIGRAAIRNRLISEAKGDYFLFVDADTMLMGTAEAYLNKWLENISLGRVICGGIHYHDSPPGDPDKYLRWKYGVTRKQKKASDRNNKPYANFSTFNVLIERSVFSKLRFYEELKQYGYEDTLFGYQLKKAGIPVFHIDNELVHEGLESNREFLAKTKMSIENLSRLYDAVTDKKTFASNVSMIRNYRIVRMFHSSRVLAGIFIRYRERMEKRLDSSKSSMVLYNFYKICMFSTYREIHRRRKLLPFFNIPPDII